MLPAGRVPASRRPRRRARSSRLRGTTERNCARVSGHLASADRPGRRASANTSSREHRPSAGRSRTAPSRRVASGSSWAPWRSGGQGATGWNRWSQESVSFEGIVTRGRRRHGTTVTLEEERRRLPQTSGGRELLPLGGASRFPAQDLRDRGDGGRDLRGRPAQQRPQPLDVDQVSVAAQPRHDLVEEPDLVSAYGHRQDQQGLGIDNLGLLETRVTGNADGDPLTPDQILILRILSYVYCEQKDMQRCDF